LLPTRLLEGRDRAMTCRFRTILGQESANLRALGYGLLLFHVDETAELIRIFDLVWIG
jgi:hypothetical protein